MPSFCLLALAVGVAGKCSQNYYKDIEEAMAVQREYNQKIEEAAATIMEVPMSDDRHELKEFKKEFRDYKLKIRNVLHRLEDLLQIEHDMDGIGSCNPTEFRELMTAIEEVAGND